MTMSAKPNRHDYLSLPKSLPAAFHEDRRSVYWENHIPAKDFSKTTVPVLTPRQEQLTKCRKLHNAYVGERPSPIWPINQTVLKATCTPRLVSLARPKSAHPDYRPCRQVRTVIPRPTLSAKPSARISELARHKSYNLLQIKPQSEWDWGEWNSDINQSALSAIASERTIMLAQPKSSHQLYRPNRAVQWPIASRTLKHMASERVNKLAEPRQISGYHEDYNPNRWTVSRAALLAQPSPRLDELATPLPRKCRTRK